MNEEDLGRRCPGTLQPSSHSGTATRLDWARLGLAPREPGLWGSLSPPGSQTDTHLPLSASERRTFKDAVRPEFGLLTAWDVQARPLLSQPHAAGHSAHMLCLPPPRVFKQGPLCHHASPARTLLGGDVPRHSPAPEFHFWNLKGDKLATFVTSWTLLVFD